MKASLDTDVIIHLYQAGKKEMLFSFFEELFVYEYISEEELKVKNRLVYEELSKDIKQGKIHIVTRSILTSMGVLGLFERYCEDAENLFDSGEMHAVSLARALGLVAIVTDDTKLYGPHDSLIRGLITDVIPFTFYEILYMQCIASKLTIDQLHSDFNKVSGLLEHPMNFNSKMKITIRRFGPQGSKRDRNWIATYCQQCSADYETKVMQIKEYIKNVG